jgi:hypothetical protein
MSTIITEEQFNANCVTSRLEASFRELVKEEFLKKHRKYLVHEVKNMAYHSGFMNLFHYEYIDHYGHVCIEKDAMINPFFGPAEDRREKLDALVIPFADGNGSVWRIKLCISVSEYGYPAYELRFQVRGVRRDIHLPVTPGNALNAIKKLQFPDRF